MKLLPSCHDVQIHLTDYAEGALPWPQRLGIWVHLLLCRVCAAFLRGLEALPGMAKTSLAPPPEPTREAMDVLAQVQSLIRKP
jgi:anti-sigma factor ChrR (cupin superfamily)